MKYREPEKKRVLLVLCWQADGGPNRFIRRDEVSCDMGMLVPPTPAEMQRAAYGAKMALWDAIAERFKGGHRAPRKEHEWTSDKSLTGYCSCGWARDNPKLRRAWNMHERQSRKRKIGSEK